jgi:hypothetical protein
VINNLYLEKLKRMDGEQLVKEMEKMGKIMETEHPLSKESKIRAQTCFSFLLNIPGVSEDDRRMLQTALKVLRIL